MINSRGVGAATAMALILVLAEPTHGLAQYRINERNERPSVPPRPPMRMVQPGPVVAPPAPAAAPYRNPAPVPPAAANRIGDHGVGQHLAVGKHAVEIENDRAVVRVQLRTQFPGVQGW